MARLTFFVLLSSFFAQYVLMTSGIPRFPMDEDMDDFAIEEVAEGIETPDDLYLEPDDFARRKKATAFMYPSYKFHIWKNLVEDNRKRDGEDDQDMERKRRTPGMYPSWEEGPRDEYDSLRRKRVVPYYFPNMRYNFMGGPNDDFKRLFWKKRGGSKRSMSDAFSNGDMSDFGYDKRQYEEDDDDDKYDKKRNKKAVLKKKKRAF